MIYLTLVYIYKSNKCDISFWRNAIPQLLQSLGSNIDISVWNLWLKMTGNLTYFSFLNIKSGFYNNLPICENFGSKSQNFKKPRKPSFRRLYLHSFDKFWCDSVNLRPAGGVFEHPPPPLRFFADSKKTAARSAAGFSPTLSPHLFGNFCESFDPGSCKVRSPGQVKWPYLTKTLQ